LPTIFTFLKKENQGVEKTYSTPKILEEIKDDNDNTIDEQATLKARLLDMFMMDFDRHEDQWRWGRNDKEKARLLLRFPRSRSTFF
jgi:hypothetical protein